MANLQYIGARYVPLLFDNPDDHSISWKSGVGYEPLTIVKYNDDTYTSRKPVPSSVGNPAANPTYWAKTSDYNAALVSLQNEVRHIEDDIIGDTDDLYTSSHEIVGAINESINESHNFKNRRIIFIADSYGNRTNSAGDHWGKLVAIKLGVTNYYEYFRNGAGFTGANQGLKFLDLLQEHENDISEKERITDVVVIGGCNDYGQNIGDIETAIGQFVAYVKTTYVNAIVRIGHVGTVRDNWTNLSRHVNYSIPAYKNCAAFGAEYLTGSEIILHNPAYLEADNLHPNSGGVDAISRGITQCMLGGRPHMKLRHNLTAYTQGYFSGVGFNGAYEEVCDDITSFRFAGGNNLQLTLANPDTIATMHEKIGTVVNGPLIIDGENKISIPVCARCVYSGTVVEINTASITIDGNGDIIFNLVLINQSAPQASIIQLYQMGCATIPTEEC